MSHVACGLCDCALGTRVSCAKTAEPIEMPFGKGQARVGKRNFVLDGVQIHALEGASLTGDIWLVVVTYLRISTLRIVCMLSVHGGRVHLPPRGDEMCTVNAAIGDAAHFQITLYNSIGLYTKVLQLIYVRI